MRLYVQWTRATPGDWEPLDIESDEDWSRLPKRGLPAGGEALDHRPGWVFALDYQGVTFSGFDHYHATPHGDALVVTVWNDDPEDFPPGKRHACVWTLDTPAPDPRHRGALNTRQHLTVYDEQVPSRWAGQGTTGGPVEVRPWAEFAPPTEARHGIWTSDDLAVRHNAARGGHSWREWAP